MKQQSNRNMALLPFVHSMRIAIVFCSMLLISCGGGGGGSGSTGGDGTSVGNRNPNQRTSGTGLRVIHAGLDVEPVDILIGGKFIDRAYFLEVTYFNGVARGPQEVVVTRAKTPEVVLGSVPIDFQQRTEYTILLSGQISSGNLDMRVIEEPVERLAIGEGRLRLLNLLENTSALTLTSGSMSTTPAAYRTATEYVDVPSGDLNFTITDARGRPISAASATVPDRGELTVVIAGVFDRGVAIVKLFTDLD